METPQLQYFSWWSMPLLCCLCSPFLVATVSTWSEYLYRFFWEMASRHFRIQLRLVRQCLHVHVSLQRRFGNFTHFCVKVDCAVRAIFWEVTSGHIVCSASWFDSGYMLLPVYGFVGTVSVYNAMLGSPWYMLCVSHGVCVFPRFYVEIDLVLRSIHVATVDFPQLPLINKVVDIPFVLQRLILWSILFRLPWRFRSCLFDVPLRSSASLL